VATGGRMKGWQAGPGPLQDILFFLFDN
jgi:hypothetical protein